MKKVAHGAVILLVVACYLLFVSIERIDSYQQTLDERSKREDSDQVQDLGQFAAQSEIISDNGLSDIFISVKTTKKFHQSRLNLILRTWFELAREQTYFFTDCEDAEYQRRTNGHLINTNCSSSHNR